MIRHWHNLGCGRDRSRPHPAPDTALPELLSPLPELCSHSRLLTPTPRPALQPLPSGERRFARCLSVPSVCLFAGSFI